MIWKPNERCLQRRRERLERRGQRRRSILQRRTVLKRRRDGRYWQVLTRSLWRRWYLVRENLPPELQKRTAIWLADRTQAHDYLALLRLYLLFLSLVDARWARECEAVLKCP